jgi:hypothetical protein
MNFVLSEKKKKWKKKLSQNNTGKLFWTDLYYKLNSKILWVKKPRIAIAVAT